ncbi:hypothetical protein PISL3812_09945 [Talaromyces islandicus]|uniref:Uncharacterized protein n=1 Tax=Talaromyces islandicus TaxID=28573 RepID=A0A0U1MCM9_TALIS|nr:hypothetical protein PISL3812_09945 [Talaromyces islandicus]
MSYFEKLPLELLFLITKNLGPFELFSLLSVYPQLGSYHDHRWPYESNQDRIVALIYGICAGRLDLIEQIPELHYLLKRFDWYALYVANPDSDGLLGSNGNEAESFANIHFRGYINPLILAIKQRSNYSREALEIVQFLLDNGAEPDIPDNFRRRYPIYIATENQDTDTVSLLLQRQATPNIITFEQSYSFFGPEPKVFPGDQECSALDIAVKQNHSELVKLLLDHGSILMSRPFHFPGLRCRERSLQSMKVLNTLIIREAYRMTDQAVLKVFRWMLPNTNLPIRRSPRVHKHKSSRVLTDSAAAALVACIKSQNPESLQHQWDLYYKPPEVISEAQPS